MTMPYSSASFGLSRVVVVDRAAPHRRPEVVALEPQDQLEHVLVELVIAAAELLLHPAGERRGFVVDEDAAVFHGRLALRVAARQHVQTRSASRTGTSAHQYHGETPIWADRSYMP